MPAAGEGPLLCWWWAWVWVWVWVWVWLWLSSHRQADRQTDSAGSINIDINVKLI
jgi:hypothetical protein